MITKKHLFLLLVISTLFQITKAQNHEWANFIEGVSGTNDKSVIELCIDDDDNIYALGEYQISVSNGVDTIATHLPGTFSLYLAKYDSIGTPIWFKPFGTKSYDFGQTLAYINGSLYIGAYFQGDSIYINDTILKRGVDEPYLLKFNTDGELLKHRSFSTLHDVTSIANIDSILYVANEDGAVRLLNEDLELLGQYTFGGTGYRNILNITAVNDTSILVSGYFSGTITYDTVSILDTITGRSLDAVFMALLSKDGSLQWMKYFGNISGQSYPFHTTYNAGDSRFYLAGTFEEAFWIEEELLAPANNRIHSFIAGFNLDGTLDFSEVFYPDAGGFVVTQNVIANNDNVFVFNKNENGSSIRYGLDTLKYKRARFYGLFKLEKNGDFVWGDAMGGVNKGTGTLKGKDIIIATNHHPFNVPVYGCDTYQENEGVIIHKIIDSLPDETPYAFFKIIKRKAKITTIGSMSNYDSFWWDFDDGSDFDTTAIHPVHVYERKGLINMSLNATNKCGTSTYTRQIRFRGIGGMYPNNTSNTNLYVGSIRGIGFKEGATFKLIDKAGVEKEICTINYVDSSTYNIIVEFERSPQADYDLFMEAADGGGDTLRNALRVNKVQNPGYIDVYFSGIPKVLVSRFYQYRLVVENKSEQAAYGVPVTILANANGSVRMGAGIYLNDVTKKWTSETGHFRGMLNSEGVEVHQAGFFIIPVLPAGKKYIFDFSLSLPEPGRATVKAYYNSPIFSVTDFFLTCSNSTDSLECPGNNVLDRIVDLFELKNNGNVQFNLSNLGCVLWSYIIGNYGELSSFPDGKDYLGEVDGGPVGTSGLINRSIDLAAMIAEEIQQANPGLSDHEVLREVDKLLDLVPDVNQYPGCESIDCPDLEPIVDSKFSCENGDCPDLEPIFADCDDFPCPELEDIVNNCGGAPCPDLENLPEPSLWQIINEVLYRLEAVAALDPNEKYPILGSDENNYIAKGRDLQYYITFENADTATAPASEVFVYDTLDLSVVDTANFEWTSFGFGDIVVGLNETGTFVLEDVDMRPYGGNVIVRFIGEIDSTGVLKVSYTSLDTITYALTNIVDDGFLPPNKSKPEGEGFFSFNIGQKPDLSHDTKIENFASIVFDRNEPIITPTAINHIDTIAPVSFVVPFASEEHHDSILHVEFSSSDAGSGTVGYNVYMSINGGGYYLIADKYPKDYMDIKVQYDSTYSFFSQAVDYVGNWEEKFIIAEASIKIVKDISGIEELENAEILIYPNPTANAVTIETGLDELVQSIGIMELTGKTIQMHTNVNASRHTIDVSEIVAGIYFIVIKTGNKSYVKKLVKE